MISHRVGGVAPAVGLLTAISIVFAYGAVGALFALPAFVVSTWAAGQMLGAGMVELGKRGVIGE